LPPSVRSIYYRVVPHELRARVKRWRDGPETSEGPVEGEQHAVGKKFDAAVREVFAVPEHGLTHPMYQTWLDYAMGTNRRGEDVARRVARYTSISGKRHLDIGSAHGGTVVAFAKAGAQSVGVEIDSRVLQLGRANVADHPQLDIQLFEGDILDASVREQLGRFDIITGEHVIEHVASVEEFLAVVADLLTDDGICHMLIPNPFCPSEVASDGHYGLFGLTLLERSTAAEYFRQIGNEGEYEVGEYCFDLGEHEAMFRSAGLVLEHTNPPEGVNLGSDVNALADQVAELSDAFALKMAAGAIPESMKAPIEDALNRYMEAFWLNRDRYARSSGQHRKSLARLLLTTYAQDAWYVIAYKKLV
jgi:2-polyprenyl-3-methyl-5-hydroxy-6-metoxy-1,4-benzoquinol methylase